MRLCLFTFLFWQQLEHYGVLGGRKLCWLIYLLLHLSLCISAGWRLQPLFWLLKRTCVQVRPCDKHNQIAFITWAYHMLIDSFEAVNQNYIGVFLVNLSSGGWGACCLVGEHLRDCPLQKYSQTSKTPPSDMSLVVQWGLACFHAVCRTQLICVTNILRRRPRDLPWALMYFIGTMRAKSQFSWRGQLQEWMNNLRFQGFIHWPVMVCMVTVLTCLWRKVLSVFRWCYFVI